MIRILITLIIILYHLKKNRNQPPILPYNISYQESVEIEESLSLEEREKELIKKALQKHNGKRKNAAKELGISERTLYRKIKEFEILK